MTEICQRCKKKPGIRSCDWTCCGVYCDDCSTRYDDRFYICKKCENEYQAAVREREKTD